MQLQAGFHCSFGPWNNSIHVYMLIRLNISSILYILKQTDSSKLQMYLKRNDVHSSVSVLFNMWKRGFNLRCYWCCFQ